MKGLGFRVLILLEYRICYYGSSLQVRHLLAVSGVGGGEGCSGGVKCMCMCVCVCVCVRVTVQG